MNALQAAGGTEMVPAMRAALTDTRNGDSNSLRQVVFLTDGEIGNEQQLFETITAMRGRSRVFMVGIGSAPNTYLMTRAAELGRGAFTHIGSVDQVEERMRDLFSKLENPAVTGLTAKFSDAAADLTPAVHPRPLSRRAAGAGRETRQAQGLGRDQGPHRRPALERDACRWRMRRKARACPNYGRAARSATPKSRAPRGKSSPRMPTRPF